MRGVRTAWAAVEVWLLTAVAHTTAGGRLPSLPWLVGVAGLVALTTAWVLRGRVSVWRAATLLVLAQLGLHLALTAASAGSAAHTGAMMPGHAHHDHALTGSPGLSAASILDELTARMVVAHVVSVLVTGFVWWLRRRAVDAVLLLGRFSHPPGPSWALLGAQTIHGVPSTHPWLLGDPGRAPPYAAAVA